MVEESTRGGRVPLRRLQAWSDGTEADGTVTDNLVLEGAVPDSARSDVEEAAARLVEVLVDGSPVERLDAERVLAFAARAVPAATSSGITLLRDGRRPTGVASAGEIGGRVDALQHRLAEGPCVDAAAGHDLVLVHDLATDPRYPAFGPRCLQETGVRSILAVHVTLPDEQGRAALNLYAEAPDAFGTADTAVAALFAPFVGLAVEARMQAHETAHLQLALESSRRIGAAVGILMAHDHLTYDDAFTLLVRASRHLNRKLRDIADEVNRTGSLPGPATR